MNYRTLIPNALTSLNLFFGVLSIFASIENKFFEAGIFIILAMLADGMDGKAARYFGVSGEFGKELDSLCDLGSFGVAASVLIYRYILFEFGIIGQIVAALFALSMAFRLARFNVMVSSVSGYFLGMPSPAGGCIIATFAISGLSVSPLIALLGTLVCAYITVSKVKYPDFKGKGNPIKLPSVLIAAILVAVILYILPSAKLMQSLPFICFFAYFVVGIVNHFYCLLFSKN